MDKTVHVTYVRPHLEYAPQQHGTLTQKRTNESLRSYREGSFELLKAKKDSATKKNCWRKKIELTSLERRRETSYTCIKYEMVAFKSLGLLF